MKILMVFHAPPYPPDIGPSRRHYHVLMETLKRHDVSVLSLGSEEDRAALIAHTGLDAGRVRFVESNRGHAAKVARSGYYLCTGRSHFHRLYRRAFQRQMGDLARARPFDAAYFSTVMLGCYTLPRDLPLVGDTHNVEHDNLARAAAESTEWWRRCGFRVQASLTRGEERRHLRRFSLVCATSERDRALFERLAPGTRVRVVPNGIDLEKYRPVASTPEPASMLFTGLMSYYPNEHAAVRFATRILPLVRARLPRARLRIVGANPGPAVRALASDHVEVTGRVPDVRPYYADAQVFVVPLSIGGGTRVKVLESMAMGVPVVSTPLGCEGLDVSDGASALLADSDRAFADAVLRVLTTEGVRAGLVAAGRAVAERYDWRRIGSVLNDALCSVVAANEQEGRACTSIADASPA